MKYKKTGNMFFQSNRKTATDKQRILFVDDEQSMLDILSEYFSLNGYDVETAINGKEALQKFSPGLFDCIVSDLSMVGIDGMELLRKIKVEDPGAMFIMVTGYPSVETAVEAIKLGAFDYVTKPLNMEDLQIKVERALYTRTLETSLSIVNDRLRKMIFLIPLIIIILAVLIGIILKSF